MTADITEERIAKLRRAIESAEQGGESVDSDVARELLDALLSARSQLAALQSVPQGVEVPELDPGANPHQRNIDNPGSFGWILNRAYRDGYDEARKNARLVPTPPQAAPGPAILNPPKQARELVAHLKRWIDTGSLRKRRPVSRTQAPRQRGEG